MVFDYMFNHCYILQQIVMLYLHPSSHAFNVITFQLILTGLASGQGMALFQPSSPYVEAVLVMGLSTIAPCGTLHWSCAARRFVLAATDEPHPVVFKGFYMVFLHAKIRPQTAVYPVD
jgi:hypothetical protein